MTEDELKMFAHLLQRTPADELVARKFLERAKQALDEAGETALQLLAAHVGESMTDLARRVNRGISVLGLIHAIYEEAIQKGVVREVSKDLLIRVIRAEFPEGWTTTGNIGPSVRIGSWDYHLKEHLPESNVARAANGISQHLANDHPPPDGWKPELKNDPLIDKLFERYWPVE